MNSDTIPSGTRIRPVPELPVAVKDAVRRKQLAVFIGAGVSRIIGCVGWKDLAADLAKLCYDKGYVSFIEKEALHNYSKSGDHKKAISICKHILQAKGEAEDFYANLERSLEADKDRLAEFPIYSELYRLRAVFVTTNMDRHFDQLFTERSLAYRSRDFAFDPDTGIDATRLYHLHGTIADRDSLVLTVADYFRRYQDNNMQRFLRFLFANYHVLFVGYGLSEFELLDFLMREHTGDSTEHRHSYLMALYSHEDNILAFEESYFGEMGIKVLAYSKDERGYDQLFEVVSQWQREINLESPYLYDTYGLIEELGADYQSAVEEKLFQLIRNDPPQERHFFKTASSPGWLIPAKDRGYFAPARHPHPVESADSPGYYHIPYWHVLDYLEKVASQLSSQRDDAIWRAIMDIIRSVSDYRGDERERIDNYHTERAFVKVMATLPIEFLDVRDIDRIGIYLRSKWRASSVVAAEIGKSLLPRLLRERAALLAARVVHIVLDYEIRVRDSEKEFVSLIEEFWLNEVMENNKPALRKLLPLEAARIALDKIEDVVSADKKQFNVIWIPAVEDHPQNPSPTRYQNILVRAARDFLDSAAGEKVEETHTLPGELLAQDHPIFPRIAFYTISTHWPKYAELFWPLLGSDLLTNVSVQHEVYELLRANQANFSQEELDRILDWIETREYWTLVDRSEDEEHERRYRAHQKLEWLTALKEAPYEKAIDKYETYLAIAGVEPQHPGFSTWMGDVQAGSISPVDVPELLEMDNLEIARCLREYRDEGEWYGKSSREGLADAFKAAVANAPQKFSADLSPFLTWPPYYLYYLLRGIKDAWDAKRDFDWQAVLSFCLELTDTDGFWMTPSKGDLDSPGWLASQVADLIEAGTRDDGHAFDESCLPLAEELLMRLLDRAPSDMYEGYDLLTAVLNSPKGRALAAALSYSLRYARLRKGEDPATRWARRVREDFTKRLDRSFDDSLEFSVTVGQYLANLAWLDNDWVVEHINEIFLRHDEKQWRAAMVGYLWPRRVRRDLYTLLKDNGHYSKALDTDFEDEHIRERLIEHLTIAYLWGDEEIREPRGLFTRLITGWTLSDLRKSVTYLWMQRGALKAEQRDRVLALWRYIFAHYHVKRELVREEAELISDLSRLAVYLDSINDEALEWLRLSVHHFRTEQDAWFLVEYLRNLAVTSPHQVGLVYVAMLESDIYPTFDKDDIVHTVDTLYAEGEKELADRICNSYGSKGFGFLRSLFDEHRDADG